MTAKNLAAAALIGAWMLLTTGCGGSSSSSPSPQASSQTVGGSVTGLLGTLVLSNNGADALTVGADGAFVFATAVPAGGAYAVTVQAQPADQLCTVSDGAGTIAANNVTNVTVNCSALTRAVGGTVAGLAPSESVVLQNNSANDLVVNANGIFVFPVPVAQSGAYAVTVLAQPAGQTCSVSNGSGIAGGADITNVQLTCATNAYTVGGTVSGLSGTVVLQNNGADNLALTGNGSFTFATPVAEGGTYNATVLTQPATQTCAVTNGSGTVGGANITNVGLTCSNNSTTLTLSVSNMALSVTGLTEYGISGIPSSGSARSITVTNTGIDTAINMAVSLPTWPSGTTSSTNCGSTLTAGSSCTITITPGATASSDGTSPCSVGTAPLPGTIQVAGDNTNTVSSNAVVLSYGCVYQGGYVYAFDDTTPTSASVGGKVAATADQASEYPNGIVWSSNGSTGGGSGGSAFTDVSYDAIPGVDETSTPFSGSPSYASFSAGFASTYTNPNPFSAASFSSCDGSFDGPCNTNNIVAFYNEFITNNTAASGNASPFTASTGPTNASYYAAGLCKLTINSYSDWYLPAHCEMGYGSATSCGGAGSPAMQNMQSNLVDFNGLNLLGGIYWSSTQAAVSGASSAWVHLFAGGGGSLLVNVSKAQQAGVRCSRALVP